MENTITKPSIFKQGSAKRNKPVIFAALVVLVLALVYLAWSALSARSPITSGVISPEVFEEQYGLRVRLIAVTAGGGMVDFRLKVVDAGKASQLLKDPERTPQLVVESSGVVLQAPPVQEEIRLEDGGIHFVLYSNSGGAVQVGSSVMIQFGDIQVGPFVAQ